MDLWVAIYLISLSESVGDGLRIVSAVIFAVIAVVTWIVLIVEESPEFIVKNKKAYIFSILFASTFGLFSMILPSKDTAYTMLAAYGVQGIAETDEAKRLGSKSFQLIEQTLDKYLDQENASNN